MLATIITSIFSFIGTNIDDTFVLAVWFSQVNGSLRRQDIVFGQLIGFEFLVLISVFAAYGLSFYRRTKLAGWVSFRLSSASESGSSIAIKQTPLMRNKSKGKTQTRHSSRKTVFPTTQAIQARNDGRLPRHHFKRRRKSHRLHPLIYGILSSRISRYRHCVHLDDWPVVLSWLSNCKFTLNQRQTRTLQTDPHPDNLYRHRHLRPVRKWRPGINLPI